MPRGCAEPRDEDDLDLVGYLDVGQRVVRDVDLKRVDGAGGNANRHGGLLGLGWLG